MHETLLPDPLLQAMSARGGMRNFPAQTIIVHEDDHSDAIFIIVKGRVKVFGTSKAGREVIYNTHGPGEYFGEMTLDGGPRSASVATLDACTCIIVPGSEVRSFLASHPDFALHLIQKLIGLVRRSTASVKRLALDDVYSRVAQLLNDLAVAQDGATRTIVERLTQQEIADRVGASREMVSRIFKQLTEGGYVALQGRQIVLMKKLPAGW
jgi:CRP/FNR family transcriptional regulator, cyclic AMP receptor protein